MMVNNLRSRPECCILAGMPDDHRVAAELAVEAGRRLRELRSRPGDAATLGREGDRIANEYLVGELRTRYPADSILSEESPDDERRLHASRVWMIDTLDGTREYSERDRTDWAVHVALWRAGSIEAAAVALPARAMVLQTGDPPVAVAKRPARPRMVVSRTRPAPFTAAVAEAVDAEVLPMGSAGAKTAAVLTGDAEIYLHGGGQYEWDSAAPAGVARASGLHVSRIDGSALVYNQRHPWIADLLICVPEHADALLSALARHS